MPLTCPVCTGTEADQIGQGHDFEYGSLPGPFTIWKCAACGHGYLDPVPAPEQLGTIYPPTYYTINPRSPIHFNEFIQAKKIRRDVDRIVALAKGRSVRNVVDLGCGDAERLARVGEVLGDGVDLIGVDLQPDPERRSELEARGVRLVQGNIEGDLDALPDGSSDLIIMCQILEHLYDPAGALRGIAKKLAPGGLLQIETPNFGGLDYRLFKRRYWGGYHIPRHFHVFTTGSLARVVADAGLEVARKGFIPSGFLIVSLRNMLGLNSNEPGDGFFEFINMKNLLVVGSVTALDLMTIGVGGRTSNQYVLARRPMNGGAGEGGG